MERKPTKKEVYRRTAHWIKLLNLAHWNLQVEIGSAESENHGEIHISDDYNDAIIKLRGDWQTWSPGKLDEVLVHELVHAHLHQIQMAALVAKTYFDDVAGRLYADRVEHELEMAVDTLTNVLINATKGA